MVQGQSNAQPQQIPPQHQQEQPGHEHAMTPKPQTEPRHKGADKLLNKAAIITGGDSGIGRAVALAFAREGADIAIVYLDEHKDAEETKKLVEGEGRRCLTFAGDVGDVEFCKSVVESTVQSLGRLDILVNNAAEQHVKQEPEDIPIDQIEKTFRTNVFAHLYMAKYCLPHMKEGSAIINTTSVTAYKGKATLLDYASTKGAIVAFTRSLSEAVVERGIRVNAVAPGPIWTPLIPATFDEKHVKEFGKNTPMKRPGQPNEVAPAYVFLACDDASYISGQVIHPNGGTIVNS